MIPYNKNYTKQQIEDILQIVYDCVKNNYYTISQNENRKENINFINNFNITTIKQKDIILKIEPEDFCHSLKNSKPGYEHETLYVFCPQVSLYDFDSEEVLVDIYVKFNIFENGLGKKVIVISFHKLNRPISYLFK